MYQDNNLSIRPAQEGDLYRLWELIYKEEAPEWKKWDAPYFPHQSKSYEEFLAKSENWLDQEDFWVICVNEEVFGIVSYYFEDQGKHWLEMGIVLHQAKNWGQGLGTRSLKLWMDHIFDKLAVTRVGLTTWSGNERMIAVAKKLGMQMEGRMRKVRFYQGQYYDSIRMGILREEWEEN